MDFGVKWRSAMACLVFLATVRCGIGDGTRDGSVAPEAGGGPAGAGGGSSTGSGGAGTSGTGGAGGTSEPDDGGTPAVARKGRIAAGNDFTCAIDKSNALSCWGSIARFVSPQSGPYKTVAASFRTICALGTNGVVQCWDIQGMALATQKPVGVFADVAVGGDVAFEYACVRAENGSLLCWNTHDDMVSKPEITTPPAGGKFSKIALAQNFMCGIALAQSISCWGVAGAINVPPSAGMFSDVSAASSYDCATGSDGHPACWTVQPQFVKGFPAGAKAVQLAASSLGATTCALLDDGKAWCATADGALPPADASAQFRELAVGKSHVCGVKKDDSVLCWGSKDALVLAPPSGLRVAP